jgi:hypothetical protein
MGDTWVTDIRHFLADDGSLPSDLPGPAERLAKYIGSIIEFATGNRIHVSCRRRPGHKRCSGIILSHVLQDEFKTIRWACPRCGDNGYITGWIGTIWDKSRQAT